MVNNKNNKIYEIIDYPQKGETYGEYKGTSPKLAAYKAFSYLAKQFDIKNTNKNNHLVFSLRNKNNNKIHTYIGTRIELNNPVIVNKNGKKITYKHRNIISKYKNI